MNTVLGVILGSIGFFCGAMTVINNYIEVDGKKKVKLSPNKMALLMICFLMFCIGFYSLLQLPFTDNVSVESTPEPSEFATTSTLNSPEPILSESISPDVLNIFIYCENDTNFTDYYVEITTPGNSKPIKCSYHNFPMNIPITPGYYYIAIFKESTGEVIYEERSDYIDGPSSFWVIPFQHPNSYASIPAASTISTSETPYKLEVEVYLRYEPVLEYIVLATNNDTGYTCSLGTGNSNASHFECFLSPGSYTVHIETEAYTIFSFIYTTSAYSDSVDPYRYSTVVMIDYSPMGGSLAYLTLDYIIELNDGLPSDEMFLYIQQPKYTNALYSDQSFRNTLDQKTHTVSLVLDRSDDKLFELFSGTLHGETYYGTSSTIRDDGTLVIYLGKPSPVLY